MSRTTLACALGAILLWALFATLVRQVGGVPPLLLTGAALCCGSLASVHQRRAWRVPARDFAFGTASLFVYHACLVAAFQLAPIAQANLVNYLWPMLIVLLAAHRTAAGLRPMQLLGCAIGFGGCALAVVPAATAFAPLHLAGYALAALAAVTWAVYSLGRRARDAAPVSPWATGGYCLGAGVLALLAHALFEPAYTLSHRECVWIAVLGFGPLGLSFVLWHRAMRHSNAAAIGSLSYLTPILSTLALALAGAIAPDGWPRLAVALVLVLGGVRLTR